MRRRRVLPLLLLLLSAIARCDIHDLLAAALQAAVVHLLLLFLFIVHLLLVVLVIHLAALIIWLLVFLVHVNVSVEGRPILVVLVIRQRVASDLLRIALITGLHYHLLDLLVHQFIL